MEAVKLAHANPDRKVVFLTIGFETTAPPNAMAVRQAKQEGLTNFSMLVSHVLVPPAIRALLASSQNRVNGFIAPGHVCTVMGFREYESLVRDFRVPIVVGGFEPVDPRSDPHASQATPAWRSARGKPICALGGL